MMRDSRPVAHDVGPVRTYVGIAQAITLDGSNADSNDNSPLTYKSTSNPKCGTLSDVAAVVLPDGRVLHQILYTASCSGAFDFTYNVTDCHGVSSEDATVKVSVPVQTSPSVVLTAERTTFKVDPDPGAIPVTARLLATVEPGINPPGVDPVDENSVTQIWVFLQEFGGVQFQDTGDGIHFECSFPISVLSPAEYTFTALVNQDPPLRIALSNKLKISVVR